MIDSLNQGNESKRNVQHNSTADQQRGTRTIARKGYPRLNHLRTLDFSVQWDGIQAHKLADQEEETGADYIGIESH